jgi:hypothetical protein
MPVSIDQLASQFERDKLQAYTDQLAKLKADSDTAKRWKEAYQTGVDKWNNGVTVANPITGAGIWYAGNALPTVISNRDTWLKRERDFRSQYDALTIEANTFLDSLVARYGSNQQVELGVYAQEFGKTLAEKEAEIKKNQESSSSTMKIVVLVIAVLALIIYVIKRK